MDLFLLLFLYLKMLVVFVYISAHRTRAQRPVSWQRAACSWRYTTLDQLYSTGCTLFRARSQRNKAEPRRLSHVQLLYLRVIPPWRTASTRSILSGFIVFLALFPAHFLLLILSLDADRLFDDFLLFIIIGFSLFSSFDFQGRSWTTKQDTLGYWTVIERRPLIATKFSSWKSRLPPPGEKRSHLFPLHPTVLFIFSY